MSFQVKNFVMSQCLNVQRLVVGLHCTWARLSQDFDRVTGAGSSRDGGRDMVMEVGRVEVGGCWRSRLAVIMCG